MTSVINAMSRFHQDVFAFPFLEDQCRRCQSFTRSKTLKTVGCRTLWKCCWAQTVCSLTQFHCLWPPSDGVSKFPSGSTCDCASNSPSAPHVSPHEPKCDSPLASPSASLFTIRLTMWWPNPTKMSDSGSSLSNQSPCAPACHQQFGLPKWQPKSLTIWLKKCWPRLQASMLQTVLTDKSRSTTLHFIMFLLSQPWHQPLVSVRAAF